VAFGALRAVHRGKYAAAALDQALVGANLSPLDRALATELLYGTVRQRRTLDAILDLLLRRPEKSTSDLRTILQLGLYQLRSMTQIPEAAAVHTTVQLAKDNRLGGLAAVVNGTLRQYLRHQSTFGPDWPTDRPTLTEGLALNHSFPDWMIELWLQQLGPGETPALCRVFNQPPDIHLRVNRLQTDRTAVLAALEAVPIQVQPLPFAPAGICLRGSVGAIPQLPGYQEAWWTVQDSSAQLVAYLLDPQPGEVIVDACSAPGGKTTHLAELMGDRGQIYALDATASRLRKVEQNCQRLGLKSVQTRLGDARQQPDWQGQIDRVLLDAPCSGLGTLHRRADARWHKTPATVAELAQLQGELLAATAAWVKPGGSLVYATCTIHPAENEEVIARFLAQSAHWSIAPPPAELSPLATSLGAITTWPHRHQGDGFFMVKLQRDR
jgi:16S rRNA (cytosine967-C5)-methyltransferase